jgi:hypothetical protein
VTAAVLDLAMDSTQLRQCGDCGWWSHWLQRGRCRNCVYGWTHCIVHGRLEWARSNHQRVTVRDLTRSVPLAGR